jgi:hypothetical protein
MKEVSNMFFVMSVVAFLMVFVMMIMSLFVDGMYDGMSFVVMMTLIVVGFGSLLLSADAEKKANEGVED